MNARNHPVAIVLVLITLLGTTAFARKWTDVSGKFSIEAEFVEVNEGSAILKKTDGTKIAVPLEKLSAADRKYIEAESKLKKRKSKGRDKAEAKDGEAKGPEVEKEKQRIKGEWKVVALITNDPGPIVSRIDLLADVMRMNFSADRVTHKHRNQGETKWKTEVGSYKLDPAKEPKQIDLLDATNKVSRCGIYEIKDDTLITCFGGSEDKDRPNEFKADGKKVYMTEYKRVKE